jgi:predicted nuclease with TOPRIM domain
VLPANANDASVDYSALREKLAAQNKVLTEQVTSQRAIVKKNQILLKEAQRLDASNKKLMDEKKKLETENADLEKQRQNLKSSQGAVQSADASSN